MPTFDIVSEVDQVEIRHATENTQRELATRFDFRGVEASVTLKDEVVTLTAESDFQCRQLLDMLSKNLVKRNVDPYVIDVDEEAVHSGKTFSLQVRFKQGIDQPMAKKIIKLVKEAKIKPLPLSKGLILASHSSLKISETESWYLAPVSHGFKIPHESRLVFL